MRYIPLTRGAVAMVDDEDFGRASKYKWHLTGDGYARRNMRLSDGRRVKQGLHQFIMDELKEVDHRDLNPLNNQKSNLRQATRSQQMANTRTRKDNRVKIKGVTRHKNKWRARVQLNGIHRHLGLFSTPDLAAAAYNTAAQQLFGEFARS